MTVINPFAVLAYCTEHKGRNIISNCDYGNKKMKTGARSNRFKKTFQRGNRPTHPSFTPLFNAAIEDWSDSRGAEPELRTVRYQRERQIYRMATSVNNPIVSYSSSSEEESSADEAAKCSEDASRNLKRKSEGDQPTTKTKLTKADDKRYASDNRGSNPIRVI